MQSLILKNDALRKDITELERKIKLLENSEKVDVIKSNSSKKTGLFGTLLKKNPINSLLSGASGEDLDNRSPKTLEAIRQVHELLLANDFPSAQAVIVEKKKALFPRTKMRAAEETRPLDLRDDYGDTPLLKAVKQGLVEVVNSLLEAGASVDLPDTHDGETPLMTAAKYGHTELAKILLGKANRDAKTKYSKKTALHFAAQYGHLEIVELLLGSGCDPKLEDSEGSTALKLAKTKEVHRVIKSTMKKQSGSNVEEMDEEEDEGKKVEDEGDALDAMMKKKERSYSQDAEMQPLFLEKAELERRKQNLELQYEDLKRKRLPKDNFDVLKNLDQAARRKFLGIDSTRADDLVLQLHDTVLKGNKPGALEDLERMLNAKKQQQQSKSNKAPKLMVDKDAGDEFGETALMKASRLGYDEMIDLLLLYKADVDLKDFDGYTAIMKAAQFGKFEAVAKLINEGADLDLTTRVGKKTALMLAAQRGHGKICALLIADGANHGLLDSDGKKAIDLCTNEEARAQLEEAMAEHPIL